MEKRRDLKFSSRLLQRRNKENKHGHKSNDQSKPLYTSSEKAKSPGQSKLEHRAASTEQVLTCLSDRNRNYTDTLEEWGVFSVGWDEIHGDLFHLDGRSHEMGQKYCGIYEKAVDSQLESAFDTIEIDDLDSCDEMEYDLDSYERYTPKYDRDVNTWTSFAMCHVDDDSPGTISTLSGDFPMEYYSDVLFTGTSPPSTGNTIDTSIDSLEGSSTKNEIISTDDIIPLDSDRNTVDLLNDNLPSVTDAHLRERISLRDETERSNHSTKTSHLHNLNNDEIECGEIDNSMARITVHEHRDRIGRKSEGKALFVRFVEKGENIPNYSILPVQPYVFGPKYKLVGDMAYYNIRPQQTILLCLNG